MNTESLLPFLGELFAKSSLLVLGAASVAVVGRRLSAAQHHALWLGVFVVLWALPCTKFFAPHWALHRSGPPPPVMMVSEAPKFISAVAPAPAVIAEPIATARAHAWPKAQALLLPVWLGGAILMVAYRLVGCWRLAGLKRRSAEGASDRTVALARIAAAELGLRGSYEIRLAKEVGIPCTWGASRPVVLLPHAAEKWSDVRLMAALRHEFGHVRRRDYLIRWVAFVACACYWPNPLVWLAARRLSAAQERACDDLVLRAGTPPTDYATLLMETASSAAGFGPSLQAALAMARSSTLEGRILAVVDETRNRLPAGRLAGLMAAIGVIVTIGASTLAQVAPEKSSPADGPAGASKTESRPPSTSPRRAAQFLLSTTILEMSEGGRPLFGAAQWPSGEPVPGEPAGRDELIGALTGVFTEAQAAAVLRKLKTDNSVDFMAQPKVTVLSGRPVIFQIRHEHDLPAGSQPPKKFVGTSLQATAVAGPDGYSIDLDLIVQRVALKKEAAVVGGKPDFLEKRVRTAVSIFDGNTVVMSLGLSPKEGRERFVLIQAEEIGAAPAPAAPPSKPPKPSITIETKFIEFRSASAQADGSMPAPKSVFSEAQWQAMSRSLSQNQGVNIISNQVVTTKAKQRAIIEMIHEFRYPTDWAKDGGGWKPATFETKNTGLTTDVDVEARADGAFELHVKPSAVQFLGFADLDNGKSVPTKGEGLQFRDNGILMQDEIPKIPDALLHDRMQAVFSERRADATVILKLGETAALSVLKEMADVRPFEQISPKGKLMVFVTVRIPDPTQTPEQIRVRARLKQAPSDAIDAVKDGRDAEHPTQIQINDQ